MDKKTLDVLPEHLSEEDKHNLMREAFFVTPTTKEDLHQWIKLYLGLDFPDSIIDEESNCSPMDMIWETYNHSRLNDDPEFTRVLYYSSRDSYKCQQKGTLLKCKKGLKKIEDIEIRDIVWTGFSWQKVTNYIEDGVKEGVEITLDNGSRHTGSPIHKYWGWRRGENFPRWIVSTDLSPCDSICNNITFDKSFSKKDIKVDRYEEGYFLGIIAGDGSTRQFDIGNYLVKLTTTDDFILDFFKKFSRERWKRAIRKTSDKITYSLAGKEVYKDLKGLGLKKCYSFEKEIPNSCLEDYSRLVGFISGLFDTDGSYGRNGSQILFPITAKKLIYQLQTALVSLGVPSRVYPHKKKYSKNQNHLVYVLSISSNDFGGVFESGIKFNAKKAGNIRNPTKLNCHDVISREYLNGFFKDLNTVIPKKIRRKNRKIKKPNINKAYKTIPRIKLLKLLDWLEDVTKDSDKESLAYLFRCKWKPVFLDRWSSVRAVKTKKAEFYDLTVTNDHSYWSNGIISHNTLGASVLEILVMVLLAKNVAHMAAIKDQSMKAQEYVKKFFNRPILRDYVTRKSERRVEFTRPNFKPDANGNVDLSKPNKDGEYNYIQILICTMQGVNFDHVPFMVVDEVDVVAHPEAYEEAKFIPAPYKGHLPITLLTSTRKFSFGLVQKEIESANATGLFVRKWNIIDVTEACPSTRHLPKEPKIPIFHSKDSLKAIDKKEFVNLPSEDANKFEKLEGYKGCLINCTLFAACKGKLATEQKSTSNLLKPIDHVRGMFKKVSPDKAKAQLLCWQPSTEGLIYKTLLRSSQMRTAKEIAEMIDDVERPEEFKKADLAAFIKSEILKDNLKPFAGIDWGHTHNFVYVFAVQDNQKRMYILECLAVPELLLDQAIRMCEEVTLPYCLSSQVMCYADSAYPMHIKQFKKGVESVLADGTIHKTSFPRIKGVKKYAGSVQGGIELVRTVLVNAVGETSLFFLEKDDGVELLWLRIGQYHWKLDAAGKPTKEPNEENDDEADATRYLVMEVYGKGKGVVAASYSEAEKAMIQKAKGMIGGGAETTKAYDNWMSRTIQEKIQKQGGNTASAKGVSGSIIWNISTDDPIDEDL